MDAIPKKLKLGALCAVLFCGMAGLPVHSQDQSFEIRVSAKCPAASKWLKLEEVRRLAKKNGSPSAPTDQLLHDELVKMSNDDIKVRAPFQAEGEHHTDHRLKQVLKVDKENLSRMKAIVARQGFPTAVEVGADGVGAAMLLVQHADADPTFQKNILAELKPRAGLDVSGDVFAMLEDRVSLAQGLPQRYGSQLDFKNGHLVPKKPIGNLKDVDARREDVGLMSMSNYVCLMGAIQS